MKVNIGVDDNGRKAVAEALGRVLADTYTLYLKTQNYHWNVTGPQFNSLHAMFEEQYIELRDAADEVAERIRSLGHFAPGSYKAYSKLTSIDEADDGVPAAEEMVRQLEIGHETLSKTANAAREAAEEVGDEVSLDMMVGRMTVHQKTAWMLRSVLGG